MKFNIPEKAKLMFDILDYNIDEIGSVLLDNVDEETLKVILDNLKERYGTRNEK